MTQHSNRTRRAALLGLALVAGLAGCDSLLEVENPNNVKQEDLDLPSSATALVNGTANRMANFDASLQRSLGLASDETVWIGSLNDRGDLDFGNFSDRNADIDGHFNQLSTARWLADETVKKLEGFQAEGTLSDPLLLARAYLFAGMAYTRVGEHFEDFVFSDRTEASPPIGAAAMPGVFDKAMAYYDKALAIAQAESNLALQRDILAIRARSKFARAMRAKLKSLPTDNPLIDDAGAVADAQAFLATNPPAEWTFQWEFTSGDAGSNPFSMDVNNRLEQRISDEYVVPTSDGRRVASVKLKDPLTDEVDPVLQKTINDFIANAQYGPLVVTSARGMRLILAEAALAQGNTAEFTAQINEIRALNSLTPYSGQIPALEMLKHARRVNLFFQNARLHDQFRFGIPSVTWIPTADLRVNPGILLPIGNTELTSNCHLAGGC